MPGPLPSLGRSSLVKVIGIGALILVLLIPLAMTREVITERQATAVEAHQEIMRAWGGEQVLGGPLLVVPYGNEPDRFGISRGERSGFLYLLPERVSVDATLDTEVRRRGLHEVPVYTARATIAGTFAPPDAGGLGIDAAGIDWERAEFALPVSDARSIRNAPQLVIGGRTLRFRPGGAALPGFPPHVAADLGDLLAGDSRDTRLDFSVDLVVGGTDQLSFLATGDETNIRIASGWPSPSFSGASLPTSHTIDANGFSAEWQVSSLARPVPSRFVQDDAHPAPVMQSAFGVGLYVPVGLYRQSDRATKYGILFIGLTFVAFFLFEVLSRLRLHPLQYLMVGLANTLFYLLLLAFSEHVGFGTAYLVSSTGSTALVTAYSAAILAGWRRAALIAVMLGLLYAFLYMTLNAEDYAMLAGAVALWVSLGFVMYVTRRIDWYRWGSGEDQPDLFDGSRT